MSGRAVGVGAAVLATAVALAVPPTGTGQQRVTCTSGDTLFLHKGIRVFSVTKRVDYSFSGRSRIEYACRGRRGKPIKLGENFTDEGNQGDYTVDFYAFSGTRYLGLTTDFNGGESCGASEYIVRDVRSRRPRHVRDNDCAFDRDSRDSESFAVTHTGALAYIYYGEAWGHPPPARSRRQRLSSARDEKVALSDIAARGELVYWTETPEGGTPVARSKALGPDTNGPESQVFANPRPPRKTGRCVRGGTTLARTVLVRVLERDGQRSACRVTEASGVALPAGELRDLQMAADRWVLALQTTTATVADVTSRDSVAIALADGAREWSLLDDGTFAWIESGGRLLAQAPGATTPTVLAEAAAAPSALAGRGRTIYWTQADGPRRADTVRPG